MLFQEFGSLTDGDWASLFLLLAAILFNLKRHITLPKWLFAYLWAIRVFFSFFMSFFVNAISEIKKPLPLLFTTSLLIIFLFDSIRMWKLTSIFTKIDLPLFPRFNPCSESFIWPIGKFFDKSRNFIKEKGFIEDALLKIGIDDKFAMYSPVFYSENKQSRLQIIFDSFHNSKPLLNCIFTSFTKNGKAIVTNNLQTVFASFYPESWDVKRCPMASLEEVFNAHINRIASKKISKFENVNSLEAINLEQHQIELENCHAGLFEKVEWSTNVTITFSGRYKLWIDMLSYSYLGINI